VSRGAERDGMDIARLARVQVAFDELLEMDPAERAPHLTRLHATDPELAVGGGCVGE
jgi:hypothetical protein